MKCIACPDAGAWMSMELQVAAQWQLLRARYFCTESNQQCVTKACVIYVRGLAQKHTAPIDLLVIC
jgi:hypothetical protein